MAGGGGSWKVAYADFTTAMMAFFMCMWLLNVSDPKELEAISNWFRPSSAKKSLLPAHDGLLPHSSLQANKLVTKAEDGSGSKNLDLGTPLASSWSPKSPKWRQKSSINLVLVPLKLF